MKQLEEQVLAIQILAEKYNHNHGGNGQFSTGGDAHTVGGAAGSGTSTLGPKHPNYVAPAKVQIDAATQAKLTEWFGKKLSDQEIVGLSGATHIPGAVVTASLTDGMGRPAGTGVFPVRFVNLLVDGGGVQADRNIEKPYPRVPVTMENSFLRVADSQQGSGVGTQMLVTQADQAAALGVTQITTEAAAGDGFNGYYTWARLGYDRPLASYSRKPEWAPDVSSMIDLMALPATADHPSGASWWKANGRTWNATFDLTPGSKSLQILHAYADARGIAHKAKDGMAAEKPKNGKGEEIPWSDEDEAIAEQVWKTLAKQWGDGKDPLPPAGPGEKQLERYVQEIEEIVGSLQKYNHEHGPNGQFGVTANGGGGGAGAVAKKPVLAEAGIAGLTRPEKGKFTPEPTNAQIRAAAQTQQNLQNAHPDTAFNFDGMHPALVPGVGKQIDKLMAKYPETAKSIDFIGTPKLGETPLWALKDGEYAAGDYSNAALSYAHDTAGNLHQVIEFNPKVMDNLQHLEFSYARSDHVGWNPAGIKSSPVTTLTHEYGHAVDFYNTSIIRKVGSSEGVKFLAWKEESLTMVNVSGYAKSAYLEDKTTGRFEGFADMFKQLHHAPQKSWVGATWHFSQQAKGWGIKSANKGADIDLSTVWIEDNGKGYGPPPEGWVCPPLDQAGDKSMVIPDRREPSMERAVKEVGRLVATLQK